MAGAAFIGLVGFLIIAPDSYNDIALVVLFAVSVDYSGYEHKLYILADCLVAYLQKM